MNTLRITVEQRKVARFQLGPLQETVRIPNWNHVQSWRSSILRKNSAALDTGLRYETPLRAIVPSQVKSELLSYPLGGEVHLIANDEAMLVPWELMPLDHTRLLGEHLATSRSAEEPRSLDAAGSSIGLTLVEPEGEQAAVQRVARSALRLILGRASDVRLALDPNVRAEDLREALGESHFSLYWGHGETEGPVQRIYGSEESIELSCATIQEAWTMLPRAVYLDACTSGYIPDSFSLWYGKSIVQTAGVLIAPHGSPDLVTSVVVATEFVRNYLGGFATSPASALFAARQAASRPERNLYICYGNPGLKSPPLDGYLGRLAGVSRSSAVGVLLRLLWRLGPRIEDITTR